MTDVLALSRPHPPAWYYSCVGAAVAAVAVPTLLAFNLPPSSTFLNQAAAIVGWGALLLVIACSSRLHLTINRGLGALLGALALLAIAAAGSFVFGSLPDSLSLSALGCLAASALVAMSAAAVSQSGVGPAVFRALCVAFIVAGVLSMVIALVQVFAPAAADGGLIAAATGDGRAAGNLRQPNHLSSLLLWSIIAAVWLAQSRPGRNVGMIALVIAFVFGLVLTGSRTGVIGVVVLGLWGALSGRQTKASRATLLGIPLAYLALWIVMDLLARTGVDALDGESRIIDTSDSPNSRLHIWANALSLIAHHPWLGVGFGEFNFAWSLTPFPHRPTAFFDHTHNLVLQFAVELGLPLAIAVLALLGYALWRAFLTGRDAGDAVAPVPRTAFMMVLMMVIHSMTEYPLWYAYFLLPTAFAFGLCLGNPYGTERARLDVDQPPAGHTASSAASGRNSPTLAAVAGLILIAGMASIVDYMRVVAIFTVDEGGPPLAQRIAEGEHSWLFSHHAHYAAATTATRPSDAMPSLKVAAHYLLDTRLMTAWATALAEAGDTERARHIAQRLREFRNDDAKAFFAPCDAPAPQGAERPFQCTSPTKQFDYRDFR